MTTNEIPVALAWVAEDYEHRRRSCILTEQQHTIARSVGQVTLAKIVKDAQNAVGRDVRLCSIEALVLAYPELVHGLTAANRQASMLIQPNRPEHPLDTLDVISVLRIGYRQRQALLRQELGLPPEVSHALQSDIDAAAGTVYFPPDGKIPVTAPWIPQPWEYLEMALPSRNPTAHM